MASKALKAVTSVLVKLPVLPEAWQEVDKHRAAGKGSKLCVTHPTTSSPETHAPVHTYDSPSEIVSRQQ
jgi:hypothetical protein